VLYSSVLETFGAYTQMHSGNVSQDNK